MYGVLTRIFFSGLLLLYSSGLMAQTRASLPSLYAVASASYAVPEGLPDPCIAMAHVTREGKLALVPCNHVRVTYDLFVYFFDGRNAWESNFDIDEGEDGTYVVFQGVSPDKRIYGYYYDRSDWQRSKNIHVFIYDPSTGTKELYPFGEDHDIKRYVEGIHATDEGFFLLTSMFGSNTFEIFKLQDQQWVRQAGFSFPQLLSLQMSAFWLQFQVTPSDFWVTGLGNHAYRISRTSASHQHYVLPDIDGTEVKNILRIITTPDQEILFYSNIQPGLFRWDKSENIIRPNAFLPDGWKASDIKRIMMGRDQLGNLLVVHQRKDNSLSGMLQDMQGTFYNYTPVISSLHDISFLGEESSWCSRDFRKELMTTGYEFNCLEVASSKPIQTFSTKKGTREIFQWDDDHLFVRPVGLFSLKDGTWKNSPTDKLLRGESNLDMRLDQQSTVWCYSDDILRSFHIPTGTLKEWPTPENISRIALLHPDTILYTSFSNTPYLMDKRTGQSHRLAIPRVQGFVNQLMVDEEGVIWIVTSKGVIRIDRVKGAYEIIDQEDGLADASIIRMYKDKRDRLWLGSFFSGVQIFDLKTREVKIINQDQGLSNNTVVSILEDDDGYFWLGTYNGVNILTPEGEIFGRIFQKDGLVDNECNRWSSYKLPDGRLCIGSLGGFNIIEPRELRSQMEEHYQPMIYLTKLGRGGQAVNVLQKVDMQRGADHPYQVVLPASDRSIQLGFALSNYAASNRGSFAYKIEGHDSDWNYIGAQSEITLSRLPAGQYRILVSGKDHRGKPTQTPAVIEVKAAEFFYLQWWFYGLMLIPLAGGALLYQYRQRQENRKLELEVLRRTETIQFQADQLREMDARKSHMYANITHEFRTPLTVIEGMSQQLGTDPKAPELIRRNTSNLLHLVNQMLDLSKLESGAMPLNIVQYDILRLIRYVADSFKTLATSRGIKFHFLTDESSLVMDFDPEKIRQIISNLLSNAIKFTPQGGEVYLQIDAIRASGSVQTDSTTTPDRLMIKVRDTGIGIPKDKIPHIFERFYQVDPGSTRIGEGTGIGLTLVSELIHLMGGEISVASQPGQGTSFTVLLPIQRSAMQVDELPFKDKDHLHLHVDPDDNQSMSVNPETHDGSLIALIVEDNLDVVHYITACLRGHFTLIIARNGQEGIDLATEHVPDIIVSDVMMPVMDGFEMCDMLKHDLRTSHIPILLLTARADVESRITGLRKGADAYLAKPFDRNELTALLDNLIENRRKLHSRYAQLTPEAVVIPEEVMEDEFIGRFRSFVESNLDDEDLDVNVLCRALAISRAQLHRKIKALTGQSTSALVRSIRLMKAKELLLRPDLNITQVAYEVGFRYPEYFTRAFGEEFGMSPSQWLEQHRPQTGAPRP